MPVIPFSCTWSHFSALQSLDCVKLKQTLEICMHVCMYVCMYVSMYVCIEIIYVANSETRRSCELLTNLLSGKFLISDGLKVLRHLNVFSVGQAAKNH